MKDTGAALKHAKDLLMPKKTLSSSDLAATPDPLHIPFNRKNLGAVGLRKWVKFERNGQTSVVQADKHNLTQQLGVQLRDLRLLDPQLALSYPSAILCREKALVVNLEHIKCIITTTHVLILNADEENVISFIEEIQRRLMPMEADGAGGEGTGNGLAKMDETPFELRALEVALDVVCTYLERLTADLEAAAHPALDALTAQVTTHNLERVRRVKGRMVRLTTRVETIRELLEKFLEDDSDMHDMNLTARQQDILERQTSLIRKSMARTSPTGGLQDAEMPHTPYRDESDSEEEEEEIAAVEMFLETYFMHCDNTYNKLQTLCEYIDDTQDYLNTARPYDHICQPVDDHDGCDSWHLWNESEQQA